MLGEAVRTKLNQIKNLQERGIFSRDEVVAIITELVSSESLENLVEPMPPALLGWFKEHTGAVIRGIQEQEHLLPERSAFSELPIIARYHHQVAEILIGLGSEGQSRKTRLGLVCLPSFGTEWALLLLGSKRRGDSLVLIHAQEKIWRPDDSTSVATRSLEVTVTPELASLIAKVWQMMLKRTKYPKVGRLGLDGVNYHYFLSNSRDGGFMAGRTWSPEQHTAPGRLVELSELLVEYILAEESNRAEIVNRIETACAWFTEIENL